MKEIIVVLFMIFLFGCLLHNKDKSNECAKYQHDTVIVNDYHNMIKVDDNTVFIEINKDKNNKHIVVQRNK